MGYRGGLMVFFFGIGIVQEFKYGMGIGIGHQEVSLHTLHIEHKHEET